MHKIVVLTRVVLRGTDRFKCGARSGLNLSNIWVTFMWTLARIPIPLFLTILFFGKVHRVLNLLSYTPKNCCAFLLKVVHLSKYNLMRCFESDSRVAIFQGAVFLGGNITAGSFPKGSVLRGGQIS